MPRRRLTEFRRFTPSTSRSVKNGPQSASACQREAVPLLANLKRWLRVTLATASAKRGNHRRLGSMLCDACPARQ